MASVHMAGIQSGRDLQDYAPKKNAKPAVFISRRDTIIIAMLVNIALLAVLFATATRKVPDAPVMQPVVTISQQAPALQVAVPEVQAEKVQAVDEIDEILKTYAKKATVTEVKAAPVEPPVVKAAPQKKPVQQAPEPVYYIVQNGDSPWKIAKKCNIKVEDLLRLNNLNEEKARNLKIGQKLRIR